MADRPRSPVLFAPPRGERGGAPPSLSYLIRELDAGQFEAHIYCPPGPAAELFRQAGAHVHTGPVAGFTHIWASTYRGRRWLLFLRELGLLPHHVLRFRRALRRHRFELVHFNDSPLIPAAWLARRESLPVVWHLRSALPDGGRDRRSELVRAAIRTLATTSIAINHDVAGVFGVDSTVVPNSVDLERFRPGDQEAAKAALGLPSERPVVSYFGFIYPSKGFREFIEAAAQLRDAGLAASYLIVGGAVRGQEFFQTVVGRSLQLADLTRDYESEAKALVDDLGMSEVVRFIPFTQDTANLYQASDVVVPGETGVLVDDYTADTLAAAVADLLRDEERRRALGRAARAHAEKNFDPSRNARRIESIYRRILPTRERIPILYVHHRPQLGGAPSSLAQLIANLDERFEPHVFCPEGPAAELFAAAGATVHTGDVSIFAHAWDSPYEGLRWLVLGREVAALPPHLRQLERLMREHRFPLVHLNDSPLHAAARFPIRLPLTIVHNSVSPAASPNGDNRASLGLPEDRVAVGFAGFVRRQKGWPELVSAAELLVEQDAPAHFVIMGGGVRPPEYFRTVRGRALAAANLLTDEESAIKELVAGKGLREHFSFLPFTAETGEIYSALDVVTFPNQGVGLGRPVLEAATYGKPVVASGSADGAGVLLPGKTGLLLDDASPPNIAAALRLLIEDPELRARLGEAAAEHARARFDPARNARAVESVYDSLLGLDRALAVAARDGRP